MICLKLAIIILLADQIAGQRHFNQRRFSPDHFNPQFQPGNQFQRNHQFQNFMPYPLFPSNEFNRDHFNRHPQNQFDHRHEQRQVPEAVGCPAIQVTRTSSDGWFGSLILTSPSDTNGANIEVTFDDFVPAFANDLTSSSSKDNRVFSINEGNKTLKRGEALRVEIFVKSPMNFKIPMITNLKFNGQQICPDHEPETLESNQSDFDTTCAKFEMKSNGTGGRWDGVLTVYLKVPSNGIRVDVELDNSAWALGNDLGDTRTRDQKQFTILSRQPVRASSRLPINFFVKFDELDEIPRLKSVSVNGVKVCISGLPTQPDRSDNFRTEAPKPSGILLTDLPFRDFPSVTLLPQQVNNENFACGSSNSLTSRFSGGSEATIGQFPFHAAIFRDRIYRCGSSLISPIAVLTAGHCVVDDNKQLLNKEDFRLLFGSVDLKSLSGSEAVREVAEIIKHPEYEYDTIIKQDIAMMIIQGNLQFTPSISPICLFDFQTPIKDFVGQRFTVLGFGSNENSKEPSRYLNHGMMSIISRQQCIESNLLFGLLPEKSAFCAKSYNRQISCPGDSGGGLIFTLNGKLYLRGISSVTITGANGKCDPEISVAFTDVSFFSDWIRQHLNSNTRSPTNF